MLEAGAAEECLREKSACESFRESRAVKVFGNVLLGLGFVLLLLHMVLGTVAGDGDDGSHGVIGIACILSALLGCCILAVPARALECCTWRPIEAVPASGETVLPNN